MEKPRLSFGSMFNMSFGFLGIQFGWGLQLANMSAVYERLGARPDEVPLLWLAAPVTGLVVQPIVGALSDRTWGPLGRRRPYFLAGAILATLAANPIFNVLSPAYVRRERLEPGYAQARQQSGVAPRHAIARTPIADSGPDQDSCLAHQPANS